MEDWKKKKKERKERKKWKDGFLIVFASVIKKDPTMLIRKHANEFKVYEETVWTASKQDLSLDHNPLIMLYGAFLEKKKCNFPSKYWFA